MTSQQIRQSFFDFFISKQHKIVSSASVIPHDDPTLLFTNAGMNQFKDVFLGTGKRDYTRCADTQKCIRVSGKHNDLEEVGRDTYHHTFFEMLGNWSFGDYYKKEAISWAWELLTEVWKLPKERLWATVYKTDDEAIELWKTVTDIEHSHILRFGEKENFWEMGETGPCGPCTEIHFDNREIINGPAAVNEGTSECIEVWNLVFIQNNRGVDGKLSLLPAKHVDTGMGFERICAVLQNKKSNYDTDVFTPIIQRIADVSKQEYFFTLDTQISNPKSQTDVAMRVIADHVRTLTFAIADGAIPSNEGRGYVLRRILRRASRFGRKLDLHEPFIFKVVETVVQQMGSVFPEIIEKQKHVERVIKSEEESFNATLDRGLEIFEHVVTDLKQSKEFPGEEAFKLYDTFGFPLDLTELMCEERGLKVDIATFMELMEEQRERSQEKNKSKWMGGPAVSFWVDDNEDVEQAMERVKSEKFNKHDFTYDKLEIEYPTMDFGRLIYEISTQEEKRFATGIILEETPFYCESGGQISDTGWVVIADSNDNLKTYSVIDIKKKDDRTVHIIDINPTESDTRVKYVSRISVDIPRRYSIMRNHTATHLFHSALRKTIGTHAHQSGSLVDPNRLRFDFNHYNKLSENELRDIEIIVNEKIRENISLQHHRNIPFDDAKKMGAMMFFGDKYGDKVNVVQFGDFSLEFCGGTHVKATGEIGFFKLLSETSISSGVRRIEAITGTTADDFLRERMNILERSKDLLNVDEKLIAEKISQLIEEKKKLEKELSKYRLLSAGTMLDTFVKNAHQQNGISIVAEKVTASDSEEMKNLGDMLREKMSKGPIGKSGVGVLASVIDEKVSLVCVVTDDVIKEKKLQAGKIVGELAKQLGGGGGGKPHLATAGGKDVAKLDEVLSTFAKFIQQQLEK
ncbi:MAG: alanine--tRNA ligase [Ignavibacteriales bacterium]|nr:alanine--tRNA ligase [Ignavibacteriales bacterium]